MNTLFFVPQTVQTGLRLLKPAQPSLTSAHTLIPRTTSGWQSNIYLSKSNPCSVSDLFLPARLHHFDFFLYLLSFICTGTKNVPLLSFLSCFPFLPLFVNVLIFFLLIIFLPSASVPLCPLFSYVFHLFFVFFFSPTTTPPSCTPSYAPPS